MLVLCLNVSVSTVCVEVFALNFLECGLSSGTAAFLRDSTMTLTYIFKVTKLEM